MENDVKREPRKCSECETSMNPFLTIDQHGTDHPYQGDEDYVILWECPTCQTAMIEDFLADWYPCPPEVYSSYTTFDTQDWQKLKGVGHDAICSAWETFKATAHRRRYADPHDPQHTRAAVCSVEDGKVHFTLN